MTVSGSVPVEPPRRGVLATERRADTVLRRADARQLRRGLGIAAVVATVVPLGSALIHLALGSALLTTALAASVGIVFLGLWLTVGRVAARWLPALAGILGIFGLVAIVLAVVSEPEGLADYAVAIVGVLPMALVLFVPWSTRAHLLWLMAGALFLLGVFITLQADPGVTRERAGLAAGFVLGGLISVVGQVTLRGARGRTAQQMRAAHQRRRDLLSGRRELRAANRRAEATLGQLQGMEAIGRALAEQGPTPQALDGVVGLMVEAFGYSFPSIYTTDGPILRLGAQRGYEHPILEFEPSFGVIGRVARTRLPAFVPDVTVDPDYMSADPGIRSEISIPLLAHETFLGVLNVESETELDEHDLAAISVVADRVAVALALAIERANLAERARVFQQVVAFAAQVTSVLAAAELYDVIVRALDAVVPAELVALTVRDAPSDTFIVRARHGSSGALGLVVEPGQGMAGRAIAEGRLIRAENYRRADSPASMGTGRTDDAYAWALGVPLIGERGTIGALTVARVAHDRPFTDLELEALDLLGGEVTLAVTNARLHGEVAELAIRDPLTGIHNRRYLDEAFRTLTAGRARLPEAERPPLSIILFDLDHFGDFNKLHGHLAGDEVLRVFGRLLLGRFREADLLGRYGGEEFVAILPGASRADACVVADEIRTSLEATTIIGAAGERTPVTVSAGCAEADAGVVTPESLIRAADVALSMAKRAGRNRVVAI